MLELIAIDEVQIKESTVRDASEVLVERESERFSIGSDCEKRGLFL